MIVNVRLLGRLLFAAYMAVLFYITLVAWNYGSSFEPSELAGRNYNYIPFRSIYRISFFSSTIRDPLFILGGNVLLFVPFGCLLPLSIQCCRQIGKTVIASFLVSSSIELCQLAFTHRVADIDDILLNTAGGAVGYCLFRLAFFIKKRVVFLPVIKSERRGK
ncbi:VanZ family protein [Shouchella clausii]|uniref:VanZ family protein n=1 Tax=Shouchella clausii TaxID=79880 RepID=UPI00211BD16B|nr:VanZ family protein [Shouchella clausii]MEB5479728.1 VanZ family protein [Shouchella clausii]MED4160392.1 VanZ family protein [Shouchella clausii]MED4178804.1 VanZ family protein [Shouchella clausii]